MVVQGLGPKRIQIMATRDWIFTHVANKTKHNKNKRKKKETFDNRTEYATIKMHKNQATAWTFDVPKPTHATPHSNKCLERECGVC